MASAGWTTVTYDYRGIGASLDGPLRTSPATMTDWALSDLPGAADWALSTFDVDQIAMVGHSVGGQVAGLYDRPEAISKMVTMTAQSGHWRYQAGRQRLSVAFNVRLTMPLITRVVGYDLHAAFGQAVDVLANRVDHMLGAFSGFHDRESFDRESVVACFQPQDRCDLAVADNVER